MNSEENLLKRIDINVGSYALNGKGFMNRKDRTSFQLHKQNIS